MVAECKLSRAQAELGITVVLALGMSKIDALAVCAIET
jgi:hypothetical protein